MPWQRSMQSRVIGSCARRQRRGPRRSRLVRLRSDRQSTDGGTLHPPWWPARRCGLATRTSTSWRCFSPLLEPRCTTSCMSPTERVRRSSTKCSLRRWRAVVQVIRIGALCVRKPVRLNGCVLFVLDLWSRTSRLLQHQAPSRSRNGRVPDRFGKRILRRAG